MRPRIDSPNHPRIVAAYPPTIVQAPELPELQHPLVQALANHSDQDLLALFRQHPTQGRYFTALFCRYSPIVYTLISHSARSPVQADYLFALVWRHLFHELQGLDLAQHPDLTLQSWLINVTAVCINTATLPPVESIHYALKEAPPPLWCYLEQALEQLPPTQRLMVLMAQTFRWSETRIAAYLQAEGERLTPAQVRAQLKDAYSHLQTSLSDDIRAIYLGDAGQQSETATIGMN